jgi:hypothetical protein
MQQDNGGYWNVKVGFDGYNEHRTEKYPNGHPNSMIARSIEGGTSFLKPMPFVAPALKAKRKEAEEAMAEAVEDYISKKTQFKE